MKKRGFTLIELLAVIVILAIIALIATPIVMNIIESSKKGANERSAENYKDAVETAIMEKRLEGTIVSDGTYSLEELTTKVGTIEINGVKATNGTIVIKDGQVQDSSTFTLNGRVVNIVDEVGKIGDFGTIIENNDIKGQTVGVPTITYNPITGEKGCTQDNTSCFGWYVLEDKGTEYAYVSLIMDRNLVNEVAWCGDETLCKIDGNWDNTKGPITAMNRLKEQTSNWKVEAKLPTYEQIYNVNNAISVSSTKWLYDYLKDTTNSEPSIYAYWTASTVGTNKAYLVNYNGILFNRTGTIESESRNGIRPVITILKNS